MEVFDGSIIYHVIHAVMMMGGTTAQPSWVSNGCNMAYLASFVVVASIENLLLRYVYSNICTLRFGIGRKVVWMLEELLCCTLCLVLIVQSICIVVINMCMEVSRRVRYFQASSQYTKYTN